MSDKRNDLEGIEEIPSFSLRMRFQGIARERDELRAQLANQDKHWREIVATVTAGNAALEAENERLDSQHQNDRVLLASNTSAEVAMLKQEVERLRAALALTRITAVELFRAGLVESLDAGVRLLDGPLAKPKE